VGPLPLKKRFKFLLGTLKVDLDNKTQSIITLKRRNIGFKANAQKQKQLFQTRFLEK